MGRAIAVLIDRELFSVFGNVSGDELPVFAHRATEELAIREATVAVQEREVDADEGGCASGVSDCDVGRTNSRPESNELKLCRTLHQVTRRFAQRLDVTSAAPVGQASSTSAATACLVAGHSVGYVL